MARRKDSADEFIELLSDSPWWVSIAFGLVAYMLARYAVVAIWPDPMTVAGVFAQIISQYSWFAAVFLIPAVRSGFRSASKRRRLDRQSGIDSIRELPWKEFEELLGEAYRRKGFTVVENSGKGTDGGIDLTLKRGAEKYLVQCKHWKTYKVGVKIVREMLGLVTAHGATGAIVVTSGVFTQEAVDFAKKQNVQLVDGEQLLAMIREVQSNSRVEAAAAEAATAAQVTDPERVCPRCGSSLVLRTARRGQNAGGNFWGCESYPKCRYTQEAAS